MNGTGTVEMDVWAGGVTIASPTQKSIYNKDLYLNSKLTLYPHWKIHLKMKTGYYPWLTIILLLETIKINIKNTK